MRNFSDTFLFFVTCELPSCELPSSLQPLGDKREVGVQLARILRSDLTRFERVFRKYLHICQGCERQRGEQSSAIDTTVRDPPPDHSCTLKPELFRLFLFFVPCYTRFVLMVQGTQRHRGELERRRKILEAAY